MDKKRQLDFLEMQLNEAISMYLLNEINLKAITRMTLTPGKDQDKAMQMKRESDMARPNLKLKIESIRDTIQDLKDGKITV